MERDAVVHRDLTQARPPACNAQLYYPPRLEEKQAHNKSTVMHLQKLGVFQ